MKFKSWRMVCKISIPVDFLFKKYNAIGNVPYLVEYGYFPSVITAYFSANCLHFSGLTVKLSCRGLNADKLSMIKIYV